MDGCGRYVVDPRLNDIWTLKHFNSRELSARDFAGGFPTLEFRLSESRVGGSTGCNRISGRFDARAETIRFGALVATRRACPQKAFEGDFLNALSPAHLLHYAISGGQLTLMDGKGITMVFQGVD